MPRQQRDVFDDNVGDVAVIQCTCCHLPQIRRNRDGAVPDLCAECEGHQGELPEKRLARAETHEHMLRQRLYNCRASEKEEKARRDAAENKASAFWESRGLLALKLVNATDQLAGLKGLVDSNVRRWAERYDRADSDWMDD